MIFMQQTQYNAPNHMRVFKNSSGGDTSYRTSFGVVTQNWASSLPKSRLCIWLGQDSVIVQHLKYTR